MSKLRGVSASAAMGLVIGAGACAKDRSAFAPEPVEAPLGQTDAAAPDGASCEGRRCSRDLRKVLSGCEDAEKVVEECGPDQGCGGGHCVDACASADLSKGSLGCSFWTVTPDESEGGGCFTAMIANTWTRPVALRAELGAEPLDIGASTYLAELTDSGVAYTPLTGPLPPGKVALVFLSQQYDTQYACPAGVTPAYPGDPVTHGTNLTEAFHIVTDAPVSAYSIYPYGGAQSYFPTATLLLPVSSWGTNYLAIMPANIDKEPDSRRRGGPRTLQIVANEDDTEVRMQPKIPILAGGPGVSAATPEEPGLWKLTRGQALQFRQDTLVEATGSPIQSNKPVAVFGGADFTNVPANAPSADVLQQQIPPIAQWGHEYALVPYRPRLGASADAREAVIYSFVGAVDGTVLTYDPVRPRYAPETLSTGQSVTFKADELVTVRSQDAAHPFHSAVYMTGSAFNGTVDRAHSNRGTVPVVFSVGDPDFVSMVAADQFLDRYIFFADYTYPETTLTIVRRKTAKGFAPVELDCAGELTDFRPLGNSGQYEYAWFQLTDTGRPVKTPIGECNYGRHEAKSDGPFSITVWGLGFCASYGYAGGTGLRPTNDVVVPIR